MRLLAEARCKGEGAAPARRAVHGDRPAHQGDQPGSDGQAQAGAAVPARGRGVLLLERPEDALLLVRRDADAGVAHGEAQPDLPLTPSPSPTSGGEGSKKRGTRGGTIRFPVFLPLSPGGG